MPLSRAFAIGFALASMLEIGLEVLELRPGFYLVKPLLLCALIAFLARVPTTRTFTKRAGLFALTFSMFGDVLLMLPYDLFLYGLVAFLIGHLGYITAFWSERTSGEPLRPGLPALVPIAGLILYGAALARYLLPHLGSMTVPVLVYAGVILSMGISAAARYGRVSRASYARALAGALIFILSDSIIASGRFVAPVPYARVLIMTTYLTAQYLLTTGLALELARSVPRGTDGSAAEGRRWAT